MEVFMITTFSSREFNQHASEAKKAANKGPVFITDRGHAAHVLLRIEDYRQLVGNNTKIADLLALEGSDEFDLSLRKPSDLAKVADFS
jgi:PHD/YefM family antitoxin component YafN of YafNO toxin-antitoxin module